VTAAIGIKRLAFAVAALFALGLGLLFSLSFFMPADKVREAVRAEIRAVTGLDPVLRGDASVSLFPKSAVRFEDVRLAGNSTGKPALTAEHVIARLRFFPLLIGRIEIADVLLVRPTITIIFNSDRSSNWSSHVEALARHLQAELKRTTSFSEIRIEDGDIILRDEAYKIVETLSNVDFSLAWPSISRSFAATGRFSWHDEAIDTTVSLTDFLAALRGDRSGLKMRLSGAPFNFAFDGYLSYRPTLRMEGALAADSASFRDTLHWIGHRPLPGGGFGRFTLKAQTNVTGTTIGLSGVHVELDGNIGEGVITFAKDSRQTVQGTLAADLLDLTPYVSTVRLLASGERGWDRKAIELDGFEGVDVDLRLSAARVNVANAKLGRTAVAANLRDNQLTVAIAESQAFGGAIKGTFGLAKSQAGADFKAQLQFTDVDLDQTLGEMFGIRRLEGKGNIGIAVESTGGSVYDLTQALNGTASLTSRKGALTGINVEQALKRMERSPLSRGGGDFRTGKTAYDSLAVNLKILDGMANVENIQIDGPNLRIQLAGSASIPDRDLDLRGTASLISNAPGGGAVPAIGFELPFMVQGAWDDPLTLLDAHSLIERSGAAQPLLDALRRHGAPDAVRQAIDRLLPGAARRPAAAPAEENPPASARKPAETQYAPAAAGSASTSEPK
jgi:AsmA protein